MKCVKILILFFMLIMGGSNWVFALPIMNENVANHGVITIYPDHENKNQFYVAPNVVMIARDASGVPVFLYQEYKKSIFKSEGLMQLTLVPSYTRQELEEAKAQILKQNPKAIFSGIPFLTSRLNFSKVLKPLVEEHDCTHVAGLIGQEQACQMLLTKHGRKAFKNSIRAKNLFMALHFDYEVSGVERGVDNKFLPARFNFGVAARIDGEQLAEYPQLIILKKR